MKEEQCTIVEGARTKTQPARGLGPSLHFISWVTGRVILDKGGGKSADLSEALLLRMEKSKVYIETGIWKGELSRKGLNLF